MEGPLQNIAGKASECKKNYLIRADRIARIMIETLAEDEQFQKHELKWQVFGIAIDLCTNLNTMRRFKEDLLKKREDPHKVLTAIIREWIKENRSRNSSVTLGKLVASVSVYGIKFNANDIKKKVEALQFQDT